MSESSETRRIGKRIATAILGLRIPALCIAQAQAQQLQGVPAVHAWSVPGVLQGIGDTFFSCTIRGTCAAIAAVALLAFAQQARAANYPQPPHDFAHPDHPHFGDIRYSPVGGNEDRPILVIYARWDDTDYPSGWDGPFVANRFFGPGFPSTTFPGVGDYYRQLSFNKLYLFPAAETQGTPYDGVVQVTVPGTKADFFTLAPAERNKRLLLLADPYVDFSSFDADGNGSISNMELIVDAFEAAPETAFWKGGGINGGVVNDLSLDGVSLGGLKVAMTNTATNLITIIHENAHAALGMIDLYGFDVGNFDVGAATIGGTDTQLWAPNAWNKMHWGWITPTVVDHDGYYDIRRADTTGDAFLLYDPDHGVDDYFLLENRRPTPGTYERAVADDGLIIWRVADAALGVSTPIGLVRPTPSASAWDASDPISPQRTMAGVAWWDGTPSNLAVRAIGRKGETIRAYLDVRGPGVLVDAYPLDNGGTAPHKVTAGGTNVIDVPQLMNTGETGCDTFLVDLVDLPANWTATTGLRILCAGESNFARTTLRPDANTPLGIYTITVRAHSTTNAALTTDTPLTVEVLSPSGTIQVAADALAELIATAVDPTIASALQSVSNDLVGNSGGTAENGALVKLASGDLLGAETKFRAAESDLLLAETAGAGDLTLIKDEVALSAESVATAAYNQAVAAIGSPSKGQAKQLARIANLIAAGRAALLAAEQLDATEDFRQATSIAVDLVKFPFPSFP